VGRAPRPRGARRPRNPDGYAHLRLADETDLELLLELDRGTEDHQRLREKARRYAKAIPRGDLDAFVLLLVPSAARADRAADSLSATAAPIVVRVWTPTSGGSPLALVREAHARSVNRLDPAALW